MALFSTESWLYRHRYSLGYAVIILAFIWLLFLAATQTPGGLSAGEHTAIVRTAGIDLQNTESLTLTNLPFYAAQRGVIEVLGISSLSIKLLPAVLSLITGIGAVFLLRRWFRPNIALLATAIVITTGQFLYIAQSASPSITYILWPVWLLLTASLITANPQHARFWKLLFFLIVPLSLYTPLSIYIVVALLSAGLLHPHVRYVVRRMSRKHLAGLTAISLTLVAPLIYLIVQRPELGLELLGAPDAWPPDIAANAVTLFNQYFNFVEPQSSARMIPLLGLGSMALIALGVWRLFKIRYTARSYTLAAWILLLLPVLLVNPVFISVTFVPLLILLASGLEFLQRSWYGIFPRNPYARAVGFVPLVILVAGLTISGLDRYFAGYRHDPAVASNFSNDLSLLEDKIQEGDAPVTLVVHKDELEFYNAVAHLQHAPRPELTVTSTAPSVAGGKLAATRAAKDTIVLPIERVIVTDTQQNADRFYIYKTK